MAETQQKHVEKAWVVKVTPRRGKPFLIDCILPRQRDARELVDLYADTGRETYSIIRVEIREL